MKSDWYKNLHSQVKEEMEVDFILYCIQHAAIKSDANRHMFFKAYRFGYERKEFEVNLPSDMKPDPSNRHMSVGYFCSECKEWFYKLCLVDKQIKHVPSQSLPDCEAHKDD